MRMKYSNKFQRHLRLTGLIYETRKTRLYNRTLPDIKRAVNKHWDFEEVFAETAIIVIRRNRNLQDILGKKTIVINKTHLRQNIDQNIYSKPCNSKLNNSCYTQVQSTNTFKSTVTHKTFKIYNKLNCKSKYLIFLMEWSYATNNTQVNLKQTLI